MPVNQRFDIKHVSRNLVFVLDMFDRRLDHGFQLVFQFFRVTVFHEKFHDLGLDLHAFAVSGWIYQRTKDVAEIAQDRAEHPYFLVEHVEHVLFYRAPRSHVKDMDYFGSLSEPVNATDALLDAHGVPRDIEIDEGIGDLKVQAFGPCIAAEKDVLLVPELLDRLVALDR